MKEGKEMIQISNLEFKIIKKKLIGVDMKIKNRKNKIFFYFYKK